MTILPDSYFKVIMYLESTELKALFLTGIWVNQIEVKIPPGVTVYGTRFKILAPEYVFGRSIGHLSQGREVLPEDFWGINTFTFGKFDDTVQHIEWQVRKALSSGDDIVEKKVHLSRYLDQARGKATVKEIESSIGWSSRQINRYLNKYIGVSLKQYLDIQRCYDSYPEITNGKLYPDEGFYDQAHFIKQIRKHTNVSPGDLYRERHDRFVQLKEIKRK